MTQIHEATDVKRFELNADFQKTFDAWKTELATRYREPCGPEEVRPDKGTLLILGEELIVAKDGATTGLLVFYRVDPYEEQF
jgi:hypothetical protein